MKKIINDVLSGAPSFV